MRSTWDAEGDARAVVASIVVGRATPTDPGLGSEPLHDFDVELFDGNRLAVEVARCSDPNAFGAEAEIEIARRVWLSTRLTYSWNAGFVRPIGVTSAAESLVGAVVSLSKRGSRHSGYGHAFSTARPSARWNQPTVRMQLD